MQRAFLLTVKPDSDYSGIKLYGGVPGRCVFLRQLYEEQKDDFCNASLTLEHMSQALMERLLMREPVTHLAVQSKATEASLMEEAAAREPYSIKYLSECYVRLCEEANSMSKMLFKDKRLLDEVLSIILKCKEIVLQYSGSILISPEVFGTNAPHKQLYKVLLGMGTFHVDHVSAYLYGLVDKHDKDISDLEQIFDPVLRLLFEDEARLELMDPVVFPILIILLFFSKHKQLSKILLKSPHWLPPPSSQLSGSAFESSTIIGKLLGLSCLPRGHGSQKESRLAECPHFAKHYNIMAKETLNVLCYVTKDITRPFASRCMVDGMATFLNYFLVLLAGKDRKKLRVTDFERHNFNPAELLCMICQIYLRLGKEEEFCRALAADGRSYSAEVFRSTIDLLHKLGCDVEMVEEFRALSIRLEIWKTKLGLEIDLPTPPEEFVDPISCALMLDPVQLPSSKKIVDKSTISRHLLSDEKDPFNRSPLRLDQVIPLPELRRKICDWMRENKVVMPSMTSDDCTD